MAKKLTSSDLLGILFGAILAVGVSAFSGNPEPPPAPPAQAASEPASVKGPA